MKRVLVRTTVPLVVLGTLAALVLGVAASSAITPPGSVNTTGLRAAMSIDRIRDGCYHQACDTIDNINDDVLAQLGGAAADATLRMLMGSPDPRESR